MSIGQLIKKDPSYSDRRETSREDLRKHIPGLMVTALAAVLVTAFLTGLYIVNDYRFPIGWDTARYLFHSNFIAERGFGTEIPNILPLAEPVAANRPGFPVLALSFSSLFQTSPLRVAAQIPIAGAIATALAIGAFASAALGLKRWEALVVTVIAVAAAPVIRLMAPETYTDNLLAAAIAVTALIPAMAAVQHGTSFLPAILLLGIAGIVHPATVAIVLAALAVTALAYAPSSWRSWRSGEASLVATPTARIGGLVSGAGAVAAIGIFGLSPSGPDVRGVYREELQKKLREDLPLYRFALSLPVAGIGAAAVAKTISSPSAGRVRHRFLMFLCLSWAAVTALGILPFLAGKDIPPHRFLALFLPLPILLGVGVLAFGRLVASRTTTTAGVVAIVLVAGAFVFLGYRDLYVNIPEDRGVVWMDKGKIDDALTAGRYLNMARVPKTAPIVFVINDHGPNPVVSVSQMTYVIAANLPPERTEQAHFYFGSPQRYLEGKPTFIRGRPRYNQMSALLWREIRPLVPRKPVALMLASYHPEYLATVQRHPELRTINNTMVLNGPPPPRPKLRQTIPASGQLRIVLFQIGILALLTVAGLGWAIALMPAGTRSREALAVSPALGIAFVVVAGLLLDRAGIRLTGLAGVAAALVAATGGWVLGARRLVRTDGHLTSD